MNYEDVLEEIEDLRESKDTEEHLIADALENLLWLKDDNFSGDLSDKDYEKHKDRFKEMYDWQLPNYF